MKRIHYENFIMKSLLSNNGVMECCDVTRSFEKKFIFGEGRVYLRERELGDRGTETYWANELRFARNSLKKKDILESNSPHGLWKLTVDGLKLARTLSADDLDLYADLPSLIIRTIKEKLALNQRSDVLKALLQPAS